MDHAPHPHIEKRKQHGKASDNKPSGLNNSLAVMRAAKHFTTAYIRVCASG